jgi:hypothetical protein
MGSVPLQVGGIEPHATGLLDGHAHEKVRKTTHDIIILCLSPCDIRVGSNLRGSVP